MSFACAQCCFNKWLGMTRRTFFHFLPSCEHEQNEHCSKKPPQLCNGIAHGQNSFQKRWTAEGKKQNSLDYPLHSSLPHRFFWTELLYAFLVAKRLAKQRSDQLLKVQQKDAKGLFLKEVDIIGKEKQSGLHPRHQQQSMSLSGRQNCPRFSLSGAHAKYHTSSYLGMLLSCQPVQLPELPAYPASCDL